MGALSGFDGLVWWTPTIAVVVVTAAALVAARRAWWAPLAGLGALAIAITAWQQTASRSELTAEGERMRALSAQLDEVARVLPRSGGGTPDDSHSIGAIRSMAGKLQELETQVAALRERYKGRHVEPETASNLSDYLRPFAAGNRLVLSCLPQDLEAFNYATELANVFKSAGWEALGPETTTIYGETPKPGIALYVRGQRGADTARTLIEAFAKFNIPYQSGLNPTDTIPDATTVELFVPPKP